MKKSKHKRHSLLTHQLGAEERQVQRTLLSLSDLGLSYGDLSSLLEGVDPNTIRRWSAGQNLGRFSQFSKIQLLHEIMELSKKAFGSESRAWFYEPNPALGNVLPATLLKDPVNGPKLVRQVLIDALSGAVA